MEPGLPAQRAREVRRIARRHGATSIRVFGSRSRGDAAPGSDLDFLVRLGRGRDLIDLISLRQDLEALLGLRVDLVEEGGLSPYLRDAILSEARSL